MFAKFLNQPEMTTADIKSWLVSLSPEEFNDLQNAQKYRRFVSNMRSNGWLNLILGSINVWLGDFYHSGDFVSLFMMGFGFALIGVSLWLIVSPSTKSALAFTVIMLVAGLYNVGFSALNGVLWVPGILGALQLWWAFQLYREYQELKSLVAVAPSKEVLYFTNQVRRGFKNAQFQFDDDLIKFRLKRLPWRGWLLEDYALFVNYKWDRANPFIVRRTDVGFEPHDEKQQDRKCIKGVFRLDEIGSWGDMKRDSFVRFQSWKSPDSAISQAHLMAFHAREQRVPLLIDKIKRGIIILILMGIMAYVFFMAQLFVKYG